MAFSVDRVAFDAVFDKLVEEVVDHLRTRNVPAQVQEYLKECVVSTSRNGKGFRALSVPQTGISLLPRHLSEKELFDLSVLGWLVEILQAYLLVHDDIIDGSVARRGSPCWYKRPQVGMMAINDGDLLKSAIFVLLKKHFQNHPAYIPILEAFHEMAFLTEVGQECDGIASSQQRIDEWTLQQYDDITELKSGYYSFYLSVLVGLYYLQLGTAANLKFTKSVLVPLGKFYQFQNDYLDIFGDVKRTGKPELGTDIPENKCSWLAIHALQLGNEDQKDILLQHYGTNTSTAVTECLRVFQSLPLKSIYFSEKNSVFRLLKGRVDQIDTSEGLRAEIFEILVDCVQQVTD